MKFIFIVSILLGGTFASAEVDFSGDLYCGKDDQCIALDPFLSDFGDLVQTDSVTAQQIGLQGLAKLSKVRWVAGGSDGKRFIDVIGRNGDQISAYEIKINKNERVLLSVGPGAVSKIGSIYVMKMTTHMGTCYINPIFC